MSKKHFEAIAAAFHQELILAEKRRDDGYKVDPGGSEVTDTACCEVNTITDLAERMARVFHEFNPRFDRVRFLSACGLNV